MPKRQYRDCLKGFGFRCRGGRVLGVQNALRPSRGEALGVEFCIPGSSVQGLRFRVG